MYVINVGYVMVKGTTTTKNNWKLSRRERKYTLQYMKCLTILCMYKLFCCFIFFFFLMGWEILFSHSLAWASTAFVSTWHCFFFLLLCVLIYEKIICLRMYAFVCVSVWKRSREIFGVKGREWKQNVPFMMTSTRTFSFWIWVMLQLPWRRY